MPTVSVIMPAYNAERYIRQAMDSVLGATLQDLELLIVNDGSTDHTAEILETYAAQDARVRVFSQANSGRPSVPKNNALQHVRGKYVCFLDHDDYIHPEKLALMVSGLDNHPAWCAAFHDMNLVDVDGNTLGTSYLHDANFLSKAAAWLTRDADNWFDCGERFFIFQSLYYAAFHTQTIMIARHRVAWEKINFDTQFAICDDTDLWLRIGLMGRVGYLDRVLGSYRQHETNITRKRVVLAQDAILLHQQNYHRTFSRMASPERAIYRRKIAHYWRELGYLHSQAHHPRLATLAYWRGARWARPWRAVMPLAKAWLRPIWRRRTHDQS